MSIREIRGKKNPALINTFNTPLLQSLNIRKNFEVKILRDDLIHPFISGNKWRKLKYNIEGFQKSGKKAIVTFGGAFSNHLIATGAASMMFGFKVIAFIRGEEVKNDYISFMKKCGMELHFVSREDYRKKHDPEFIKQLLISALNDSDPSEYFIIPEGGSNEAAVKGCSEIMNDVSECDYVVCACGTGATLAGIARGLKEGQTAIGVSVLKAEGYIEKQVLQFNGDLRNTIIIDDYHFGGYAKSNDELINFCKEFSGQTQIPIEPIYTGKMIFAVNDLISKGYFKKGSRIVLIHTGGVFDFKNEN